VRMATLVGLKTRFAAAMGYVAGGSQADICGAKRHVRFTPNGDRESGHAPMVRSALPPIADMCTARGNVCYGPIADMPNVRVIIAGSKGNKMKTLLLLIGLIVCAAGIFFAGQGLGYINWPASSFMISQMKWVYYGGGIAIVGILLVIIALR
jgi:hypothetical protein